MSFATGTFARSWKMAEVIPVPKSGDFNEPANTRPISLLPILSKVCERLAHRHFVDFLNHSGKISKFQSGNRESHSTETALLQFTDDILKNVDENDLLSVPKHWRSSGYVDDTEFFLSLPPRDITDASNALNQDLLEISRWCCENSLLINPDKTKRLVIGVPQLLRNLPRLSIIIITLSGIVAHFAG